MILGFSSLPAELEIRTFNRYLGSSRADVERFLNTWFIDKQETNEHKIVLQIIPNGYYVYLLFTDNNQCNAIEWDKVFEEQQKTEMQASLTAEKSELKADGWQLSKEFIDANGHPTQIYERDNLERIIVTVYENGFRLEMKIEEKPIIDFLK